MTIIKSGIILAAGLSSRMGSCKPFMDINGKKMIDWTVDSMIDGGVKDLIIVTGYRSLDIQKHLSLSYPGMLKFVKNEDYHITKAYVLSNTREIKTKGKIIYIPIYFVMFL